MKDDFMEKPESETIAFIIPRELFLLFKIDCAEKKESMSDRLMEYVKNDLKKAGKFKDDIFKEKKEW